MEKLGDLAIMVLEPGDDDLSMDGQQAQAQQVRLASIVSIDVKGFSTMSERDQSRAFRHVESLRKRIGATAEANGGRVFNTAGDGFMLEFPSAGAALTCINDLLDKRPRGEPLIRVGAHVGDVIVTITNDLIGHGVNVAARLQALAKPGTAIVSGEFRSMARNSPRAAFMAKGKRPLDNMEQRVQTFAIISERQQIMRKVKSVGAVLAAAGVAAGLYFAYPRAADLAKQYGVGDISVDHLMSLSAPAAEPKKP
jgi:class 3 adenylate cyclase